MNPRLILLAAVLLIGIALRIIELISGNFIFSYDQGRDYVAVKHIVEDHKFTLIGSEAGAGNAGINGLFHGPGYYYILSVFYVLFAGNPYGGQVLMFFGGLASLVLAVILAKMLFDGYYRELFVFLIAVSPNIASQSRFIWNHHLTTPLILAVFIFFLMATRGKFIGYLFALFTAGIIYNFELAIAVPLLLGLLIWGVSAYRKNPIRIITALIVSVIPFTPLLLFEIRHNLMAFSGIVRYFSGTREFTGYNIMLITSHLSDYANNINATFAAAEFFPPKLTLLITLSIICWTGYRLYKAPNDSGHDFIKGLFIMLAVTYLFFFMLRNSVWDYYLIHLHIIYIILVTFSLRQILSGPRGKVFLPVAGLLLVVMGIGVAGRLYLDYAYDLSDYGGIEKIRGKQALIDFVYADAQKTPFNIAVFTPAVYTYAYDYLFFWYGQKKYGYEPGHEIQGLTYLVIQPDPAKPWSYRGWLETVIPHGDIINTVYLPEGFIVQKRMYPL